MATVDQWFAAVEGQRQQLAALATTAGQIRASIDALAGAGSAAGDVAALAQRVDQLTASVAALQLASEPAWAELLTKLETTMSAIGAGMPAALNQAADKFALATHTESGELVDVLEKIRAAIAAAGGAAPAPGDPTPASIGGLLGLAPLLIPGAAGASTKAATVGIAAGVKTGLITFADATRTAAEILSLALAILPLLVDKKTIDTIGKQLDQILGTTIVSSVLAGSGVMGIIEAPLEKLVEGALKQLDGTLHGPGAGTIHGAEAVAVDAILQARKFGLAAHGLAAAAERFAPLKVLGLGAAAAAIVDLAGFQGYADAATRAKIAGAISRPMRWAANSQYRPEIPGPADLERWVQKRELDLPAYGALMAFHGFSEQDIEAYTRTVYRDFAIRDIALAFEDASIDEAWLTPRIRTIGYDDADADQLTRGLVQRAQRVPRGRVLTAAAAAAGDGLMAIGEFEGLLRGLGLRDDVVALEVQAARIRQRADYQRQAVATYRRQYQADILDRSALALALGALGLTPDRLALELADADAQRAPQIQRAEEAAVRETMTQIRAQLVPRYRQLYSMGVVDGETYQRILEQAGIAPGLAAQAVSLDALKLQAQAQKTGNVEAERALDRLLAERQQLVRIQFRRGIIDAGGLRAGLIAAGLPPARADVQVAAEQALQIPPPRATPEPPAEAKDSIERAFRRRAAIEDFRRGRLDPDGLYAELVAAGRTPAEAEAEVNYEWARLPNPKPTSG